MLRQTQELVREGQPLGKLAQETNFIFIIYLVCTYIKYKLIASTECFLGTRNSYKDFSE